MGPVTVFSQNLWLQRGCTSDCVLLEHKWNFGLGMDALVGTHMKVGLDMDVSVTILFLEHEIMVWAWML